MQLDDLTPEEQTALGGLLRMMVRSDGSFSEAEEATVDALAKRIAGEPQRLWRVISQSAQDCPSDHAIETATDKVTRPEVRNAIRGWLQEVAAGDEVADAERDLLAWLDERWS